MTLRARLIDGVGRGSPVTKVEGHRGVNAGDTVTRYGQEVMLAINFVLVQPVQLAFPQEVSAKEATKAFSVVIMRA